MIVDLIFSRILNLMLMVKINTMGTNNILCLSCYSEVLKARLLWTEPCNRKFLRSLISTNNINKTSTLGGN